MFLFFYFFVYLCISFYLYFGTGNRKQFVAAVANDGRSYSHEVFMNALDIMRKQHGLRPAFPAVCLS